jgi:hypothetical protein
MPDRPSRRWIYIGLMALATAWYARPQAIYSLVPIYEAFQYLFPQSMLGLRPWIELIRSSVGS